MKRLIYFAMAALMVLAVSCNKDPKVHGPSVKTLEATGIGVSGARLHAQIDFGSVDWGGVNYGFYWGTSEDALDTYIMADELMDEENAYFAVLSDLVPETEYWYRAYVEIDDKSYSGEILSFTTEKILIAVPEVVDLGVVVNGKNIKWASFNLGATKPEEYGNYYAWGETTPSSDYEWSTYTFGSGSSGPFSKYNTKESYGPVDNNTELDPGPEGDDVASKLLGGKWRMPTQAEFQELNNTCTSARTTQNGVNGRLFTSMKNGNSIFLPAAGVRIVNSLFNDTIGYYWSSSLDTNDPGRARSFVFNSSNASTDYSSRSNGLSVRPVYVE